MNTPASVVLKELVKVVLILAGFFFGCVILLIVLPGLIPNWIVGILGTIIIGAMMYFDKREFHWFYVVLAVLIIVFFWLALYKFL